MTKAFKQAQNGVWGKNEFMKKINEQKKKKKKKKQNLRNEIKSSYCDAFFKNRITAFIIINNNISSVSWMWRTRFSSSEKSFSACGAPAAPRRFSVSVRKTGGLCPSRRCSGGKFPTEQRSRFCWSTIHIEFSKLEDIFNKPELVTESFVSHLRTNSSGCFWVNSLKKNLQKSWIEFLFLYVSQINSSARDMLLHTSATFCC